MPATPNYALPYPAAADPADVPTDMGKLANAVDALAGIGYWKAGGGGIYSSLFSYVQRPGVGDPALGAMVVGDSAWRFYMDASGVMRWSAGAGSYDVTLTRLAAGLLATTDSTLASARDMVVNRGVANQIWLNTDGRIYFGSANDTVLYRSAASTLRTDGTFSVLGGVTVGQGISAGATISCSPYFVASSGATQTVVGDVSLWTPGNVHAPGVVFNDVTLYRSAPGTLMVYAGLSAAGTIAAYVTATDAQPQVAIVRNAQGAGLPGILFGAGGSSSADVTFYRSAAFTLKNTGFLAGAGWIRSDQDVTAYNGTVNQVAVGLNNGAAGPAITFGNANDTNLYRLQAGVLRTDGQLQAAGNIVGASGVYSQPTGNGGGFIYNPTATGGIALYVSVVGEANSRFYINGNGGMNWGVGGATGVDTNLYREAANVLRTEGAWHVAGDSVSHIAATSQISLSDSAGKPIIYFGNLADVYLYRTAASVLRTDGALQAGTYVSGAPNSVQETTIGNVGPGGTAGIKFSNANDTNLYRLSAGALKTDTHLRVGQSIALDAVDAQHGLYFGSALDTFLYRGGPGQLAVNGAFSVGGPALETLRNMGTKAGVGGGRIRSYGDWGFGIDNTTAGYSIDATSSIHAVSFPTSSDERLKTAIAPLKGAVEALKRIRAISFEWDPNHGTQRSYPIGEGVIGVTAQSVQDVYPEVVSEWNVTEEGPGMETVLTGETRLAVDYGRLVAPLIAAIGELDERLGALEAAT